MNQKLRNPPKLYAKLSDGALMQLVYGGAPDVAAKAQKELDSRALGRPVEDVEVVPWWCDKL